MDCAHRPPETLEQFVMRVAEDWSSVHQLHDDAIAAYGSRRWKFQTIGSVCAKMVRDGKLESRWEPIDKKPIGRKGRRCEYRVRTARERSE